MRRRDLCETESVTFAIPSIVSTLKSVAVEGSKSVVQYNSALEF